jgi:L,D-transpeptidase-like protein/putative peptidoglycan binding protein
MRRRRQSEGSLLAGALTVLFVSSAILATPAVASRKADREPSATASAAAPTELSLESRERAPRYGSKFVLTAKLTSAGRPLAGRSVSLQSGATGVGVATTDAGGVAKFELEATRNQSFDARFAPSTPADVAAYQPAASTPVQVIVRPIVKLRLASPLRAGRKVVGIPGVRVRARGRVVPFVAGAQVTVRVIRRGREVRSRTAPVTKSGNGGRFTVAFKLPKRGGYVVTAVQGAGAELGPGRASSRHLLVVRGSAGPGASGPAVRALQRRLKALGYVARVNGHFDGSTSRAVLAFRKVFGMSRIPVANRAVFRRLAKGGGRFRVRYPKAGRHVEFDWSRQVLVLARGSRPVKVLHASSGKPSTPTVFGSFHFYSKRPGYNAKGMYYSNYFIGGYAIHGYASVPTFAASHGCIRIPIPSAISVYRWVRIGTKIFVYK